MMTRIINNAVVFYNDLGEERYRERWNRSEKRETLEKRKDEFRRRLEEKRARMEFMSDEEREDFKFKMRMRWPDAAEEDSKEKTGEPEAAGQARNEKTERKSKPKDDFDTILGWFKPDSANEQAKAKHFAEMLKKRKEEEQRKKVKDFEEERERRNVEAQEEWEKWETERRVHDQDWRRDVESERAQARQQYKVFEDQQSSGRMWADDPMMEGVREKGGFTGDWRSWANEGYARTRQVYEDATQAKPFTVAHTSVAKGGVTDSRIYRASTAFLVTVLGSILGLLGWELSHYFGDESDNRMSDLAAAASKK